MKVKLLKDTQVYLATGDEFDASESYAAHLVALGFAEILPEVVEIPPPKPKPSSK